MRVLIGCEYSGVVRDAFAARGHTAVSCDLPPTADRWKLRSTTLQGIAEAMAAQWGESYAAAACSGLTRQIKVFCLATFARKTTSFAMDGHKSGKRMDTHWITFMKRPV